MTTEISPEMRMALAQEALRVARHKVTLQLRNVEGSIKDAHDAMKEFSAAVKRAKELDA